jgi:hypothetical protein
MIEQYISALQELSNPSINDGYELQTWQSQITNVLVRVYGKDSKQEELVNSIQYRNHPSWGINGKSYGGGNNAASCQTQASELAKSFVSDLEKFGLPELKQEGGNGINISLNQSQNQVVNLSVIWESVKDELTGKQAREIEEIIEGDEEPESKKKKIFEKIKTFGSNVASNIVAGLLTNPSIFGG